MGWVRWVVVALALAEAGWMTFDGARAFAVGDYVTPGSGPYAGQLGPWTRVVSAVGINPRSTLMKSIFLGYGAAWIAVVLGYVFKTSWAWTAMLLAAAGSLWFLPVGTLFSAIQIVLLLISRKAA